MTCNLNLSENHFAMKKSSRKKNTRKSRARRSRVRRSRARKSTRRSRARRSRVRRSRARKSTRRSRARKSTRRSRARKSTRRSRARKSTRRSRARKSTRRSRARKSTRRSRARKSTRRSRARFSTRRSRVRRSRASGRKYGKGWAKLAQLGGDVETALAILRTDDWAPGVSEDQVRIIGSDGKEVQPKARNITNLTGSVGKYLVLPNGTTVTKLQATYNVEGVKGTLKNLAKDCRKGITTKENLAPAYEIVSVSAEATHGQPKPTLKLKIPNDDLPMGAFSVVANKGIFDKFKSLANDQNVKTFLQSQHKVATKSCTNGVVAHMAYMLANDWNTSDPGVCRAV